MACDDLRALAQQVKDLDERRPTVDAPVLRVQVHELRRLASILRDRLQAPVLDDVGDKALLVLYLHRVKDAPVRIDADKERMLRREVGQRASRIIHVVKIQNVERSQGQNAATLKESHQTPLKAL